MFDWKEIYGSGVADIDVQHKRLFVLMADLYEIASLNDGMDYYDQIKAVFSELKKYTVYHFEYEEKLMQDNHYNPLEFKIHKLEHGSFINKMTKIEKEDLDKRQDEILQEAIIFTANWIEQHILGTDRKYKEFLNSCGVY
ncbi:Hypothetical protein LUCI_1905 [Lucifera butyrica]|uniref:Hemerythrin-like domain-containing protein n=1 Tax=Lucifera butyrica TaxID=1351585 RepID=A0A498R668_9FIRM|nr:bacteriohemerythrin [Lucifera butyrica]VBB06669.1 Hypothetical protein LUCI_1905 [Lucifera butyrica]